MAARWTLDKTSLHEFGCKSDGAKTYTNFDKHLLCALDGIPWVDNQSCQRSGLSRLLLFRMFSGFVILPWIGLSRAPFVHAVAFLCSWKARFLWSAILYQPKALQVHSHTRILGSFRLESLTLLPGTNCLVLKLAQHCVTWPRTACAERCPITHLFFFFLLYFALFSGLYWVLLPSDGTPQCIFSSPCSNEKTDTALGH